MSFTCEYCGKEKYNSMWVMNDNDNEIPICRACHEKIARPHKAMKDYEQIMIEFNRKLKERK